MRSGTRETSTVITVIGNEVVGAVPAPSGEMPNGGEGKKRKRAPGDCGERRRSQDRKGARAPRGCRFSARGAKAKEQRQCRETKGGARCSAVGTASTRRRCWGCEDAPAPASELRLQRREGAAWSPLELKRSESEGATPMSRDKRQSSVLGCE